MRQLRHATGTAGILLLLLVTACAPILTNRDAEPLRHPLYTEWPVEPAPGRSMLVVVNPYTVRCCGASPTYSIRIMAPGVEYSNRGLMPVDDFFCVVLEPGDYRVELQLSLREHPITRDVSFTTLPGSTDFLAADVNTLEPEKTRLRLMPETQAMVYVNRALDRVLRPVWDDGESLRGDAARRSPLVRRALRCDTVH